MANTPTTMSLLRDLRRRQGKSLRRAAADVGIAPSQLSRLERRQRGLAADVNLRLSTYYGVSVDQLAMDSGELPADVVQILLQNPSEILRLRKIYGDSRT